MATMPSIKLKAGAFPPSLSEDDWDAYCRQHVATEARQMADLWARIDRAKLCARASRLRGGVPCRTDLSVKNLPAMMGGQTATLRSHSTTA